MHCNYCEISRIDNVITYKYNKISTLCGCRNAYRQRTDILQVQKLYRSNGWMDGWFLKVKELKGVQWEPLQPNDCNAFTHN